MRRSRSATSSCDGIGLRTDRLGNDAVEILADHGQRAADEVAVAVGEVGVVAGDEGVEGEAAVLAEGDFAQQEVAEDVGAENVEDGFGADHVAARFGHLRLFEEQPAVGDHGLGQRQAGGHQECGPVDAVEAGDLFADEVQVGGPVLVEFG